MAKPTVPPPGVLNAITIIERVGSVFSLLGCLFIIVTFLSSSDFRRPINRLVFYASFGNMLVNVGTLIARSNTHQENSAGCQFQAFLIQEFLPSDALWAFAMALNVYLTFYFKFDAAGLKRMEKWYLLICYGLPLPAALAYIFISNESRGRVYGDAILWCWVSPSWEVLRIATFYGPIWVIILATFFIYIRAGREIYTKRRQLRKLDSSENGGYDAEAPKPHELYPIRTTEIKVTSESVAGPRGEANGDATQSPTRESRAYSITISSDREPPPPVPTSAGVLTSSAQAKAKRKWNRDFNRAAWAYTKCAILFFTALLVTWIPSSANRVYSIAHGGETVVVLELLSAVVLPLQGFWNAVIYVVTSWEAVKVFFSELVHHARHGNRNSTPHYGGSSPNQRNRSLNLWCLNNKGDESDSVTELTRHATPISKLP